MSHPLTIYRQEIIEAEKARTTFMQWKLVVVGAVASFGLSATHIQDVQTRTIILMIIPLACLYVDVCCYQITLRILVIADFLTRIIGQEPFRESIVDAPIHIAYENHCRDKWKNSFFQLEDYVLVWSSIACDALLILYSAMRYEEIKYSLVIIVISVVGGGGSFVAYRVFRHKARQLDWIKGR